MKQVRDREFRKAVVMSKSGFVSADYSSNCIVMQLMPCGIRVLSIVDYRPKIMNTLIDYQVWCFLSEFDLRSRVVL